MDTDVKNELVTLLKSLNELVQEVIKKVKEA